jgi:ribonuclease HI
MLKNSYTIYTDGSDFKHSKGRRLGIGGVIVDNNTGKELSRFGKEISREDILEQYNTNECSNPFAEMLAVKTALEIFGDLNLRIPAQIIIKSDFQGVTYWMTGEWEAKAPYIKQVKEEILDLLKKKKNWEVEFVWIKGHRSIMDKDSYFNNLCDKLAKNGLT